mmetsp:Transcript_10816/g.31909  ORF Transcript_10816/g.31909 Transcript_10816/m.31909 type:complete len:204 (-) Transcript_10816:1203-1814(-)
MRPPSQSATNTVGAPPNKSSTSDSGAPLTSTLRDADASIVPHIQARGWFGLMSPSPNATLSLEDTTPLITSKREPCRRRFLSNGPSDNNALGSTTTCGASESTICRFCWIIVLTAPMPPPNSNTLMDGFVSSTSTLTPFASTFPGTRQVRGMISLNSQQTTNCSKASWFSFVTSLPSMFSSKNEGMMPLPLGNFLVPSKSGWS